MASALGVMARWLSISAALRRISSTRLDSLDTCGVARPPCCRESEKASAPCCNVEGQGGENLAKAWDCLSILDHFWHIPSYLRLESSEDHQLEGELPASPGCSLHTH